MSETLIVQKYGGSSLDSPSRIKDVASKIAECARKRCRMAIIVSAMGSTTDELMRLAYQISDHPSRRELDMLLTVGERISMALLSMALNDLGFPAISFTGSQSGIVTSTIHTRAVIEEIRAHRIMEALESGKIAIVAGFQGVSRKKEITTLGRGGSDTSAVALAVVLHAQRCEIYSNYSGLFTADPRHISAASAIHEISYDEMLELASLGAAVLHYRAADIARRNRMPVLLLSSFQDGEGTIVRGEPNMENPCAKSVTNNERVCFIRAAFANQEAPQDTIARALESNGIRLIFYEKSHWSGKTEAHCILDASDSEKAESILRALGGRNSEISVNKDAAVVSVVGYGFAHRADAISRVERTLAEGGITVIFVWSTSLSVSCLVPKSMCKEATKSLHAAFFPKNDGLCSFP